MRGPGWQGFLIWTVVGVLWGFTALAMMSIGIFILPVAIGATVLVARRFAIWPDIPGARERASICNGLSRVALLVQRQVWWRQ